MKTNRRNFMKCSLGGLAYFTLESTTPNWLIRSAQALDCLPEDRILVILQQGGGNDGLNTVIPRTDDIYYDSKTRPNIRIPKGMEFNLDGSNGLHPQLTGIADWFQKGKVAIVQNVGYPNPNLSHFVSTDYWEFGGAPGSPLPRQGWVARLYDSNCPTVNDDALFMVTAGKSGSTPDALEGMTGYTPPTIANAGSYKRTANTDRDLRFAAIEALNSQTTTNPMLDFVQRSHHTVAASTEDIAVASEVPQLAEDGAYTSDSLGRGLKLSSQIIRAGFGTRIFYVTQGGYDTHANEVDPADPGNAGSHATLMSKFNTNIHAFLREMEQSGNLDRIVLMTFSEFGRRVGENGSKGTDHGAGNCLFLMGGQIRGGTYGGQPDLRSQNLIKGNLKYRIDFRSVYSQVVEGWLGKQAAPIFGQDLYNDVIADQLTELNFLAGAQRRR